MPMRRPSEASSAITLARSTRGTPKERYRQGQTSSLRVACKIIVALDAARAVVGVILYGREEDKYVVYSLGVVRDRRREGIATMLKKAAVADLVEACGGRIDVLSLVHRRNVAMRAVNEKLGASSERDPTDGEYLLTGYAAEPEEADESEGLGLTAFRTKMKARRAAPGSPPADSQVVARPSGTAPGLSRATTQAPPSSRVSDQPHRRRELSRGRLAARRALLLPADTLSQPARPGMAACPSE